jgi:hypothetical protein
MKHECGRREMHTAYTILVGKPLGRHSHRWGGNIKIGFREIVWEVGDWTNVTQGSVAAFCEHGNEPSGSIKGGGIS